jgi:hypothetical protein
MTLAHTTVSGIDTFTQKSVGAPVVCGRTAQGLYSSMTRARRVLPGPGPELVRFQI